MKASIFHAVGEKLTVEDVELDGPRAGEIRLRVQASGLCHSDYHLIAGDNATTTPAVLGHEAAGIVEAVGDGVFGIAVGDRVATSFSAFCGECAQCQTGFNYRCDAKPTGMAREAGSRITWKRRPVYQLAGIGGFAEAVVAHQRSVVKIPEGVPAECAALMGCAVQTGVGAALYGGRVQAGSTVVVIGCGGVGLNVVQGARIAGAAVIIAIDVSAAKLAAARKFGATDTVLGGPDAVAEVLEISGGGVDTAFEVIGLPATLLQAFKMLRKGGTAVLVGMPRTGAEVALPMASLMFNEVRVVGSLMGSSPFQILLPKLARLYRDGKLMLDELVSDRISLGEINEGYARMIKGETRRNVVVF